MSDFRPVTDLNPDHYAFRRTYPGWYPDEPRETHADRWADRIVVLTCLLVIALIVAGALR
jgi:hypothetical protein